MPRVTTSYRLYLGRRSRRRRRAGGEAGFVDLLRPETNTVSGTYHPAAPSHLPYAADGASVICPFLFWSVRGAADGASTRSDQHPEVALGSTDATVTAWYRHPGGGGGPGEGSLVEVDAFSLHVDDFVDETPIVRSDPPEAQGRGDDDNVLLTADAAVSAEVGANLGSDPQSAFERWVALLPGRSRGTLLFEEHKAEGFAIVSYRRPVPTEPQQVVFREGYQVIGNVAVDGGGWLIGPDGRPIPVGPWDPAVVEAVRASGAPLVSAPPWDTPTILDLQQQIVGDALAALSKEVAAGNIGLIGVKEIGDLPWKP